MQQAKVAASPETPISWKGEILSKPGATETMRYRPRNDDQRPVVDGPRCGFSRSLQHPDFWALQRPWFV
jgi:hypothetical protein